MDYLRKSWARARAILVSMPPSQRYSVVALLAVVILSLAMLVTWGGRAGFDKPALSGLSPAEMNSATKALDEARIEYRIAGDMILVKAADKDRIPMLLAEKGALPSDISKTYTFEDIVKPKGFSMETDQEQRTKYNIALGNTLARSIASSPNIAKAEVYIDSDRDGFFGKEEATAAVFMKPRDDEPVPERQLAAICKVVAAAVGRKLSAKSVTVMNLSTGESFSLESEDSPFIRAAGRMELQRTYDKYYSEQVERFLAPALGPVRTVVTVKWDASTRTTTETEFAVTNETKNTTSTTAPASPGGETLTQPNVATSVLTAASAASAATSESEQKTKVSEPSKTVSTETPAGQVMDIALSVLADRAKVEASVAARRGVKQTDNQTGGEAPSVTEDEIKQECAFWKNALLAGLPKDPTSKVTSIEFAAAPFAKVQSVAATVALPASSRMFDVFAANWHRVALGLLALVALFMIRGLARRTDDESIRANLAAPSREEDIPLPEVEVDMDAKRADKMRESIEDLARTDPQTVASLVRRWMARES